MSRESQVCRIVVDLFEGRSGVAEALQSQGVDVEMAQLRIGDYDLGNGVLVERKTVRDLHLSLERGRLWRQVGGLRRVARLPYLLVEGCDLDEGSISPTAIRGACLAVVGQGVPVVRSVGAHDTAMWLRVLAQRAAAARLGRDRPVYAQRLKPKPDLVAEAMLASVPGISVVGARALLGRFGTVAGVLAADEGEWLAVPGIGPSRASALRAAVS